MAVDQRCMLVEERDGEAWRRHRHHVDQRGRHFVVAIVEHKGVRQRNTSVFSPSSDGMPVAAGLS